MTTLVNPRFDGHGDPLARSAEFWLEWWAAELRMLGVWQQAVLGLQRNAFDLWACRFAGGAPLGD